jgi:sugar lactone lactonase YvrE
LLSADEQVGFIVPRQAGDFIIGLGRRLALWSWDSNVVNTIHEIPLGPNSSPETARFNDGKCDPKGRVWAGEPSFFPKGWKPSVICMVDIKNSK